MLHECTCSLILSSTSEIKEKIVTVLVCPCSHPRPPCYLPSPGMQAQRHDLIAASLWGRKLTENTNRLAAVRNSVKASPRKLNYLKGAAIKVSLGEGSNLDFHREGGLPQPAQGERLFSNIWKSKSALVYGEIFGVLSVVFHLPMFCLG